MKKVNKGPINKELIEHVTLESIATDLFRRYGEHVLVNRAIPDFRDGLKPVQRRILWSMYKMGVRNNTPFKKSARIVGDVIGKYHPHGSDPVYKAMVNLTQAELANFLIEGQGNWGGYNAEPAAERYTEARMSKITDDYLLDKEYLDITQLVPNFDGEEEEPTCLPALVPFLLLNGAHGIAAGTTTAIPEFELKGVAKLAALACEGKPITPKLCLKYLRFKYRYGAVCTSSDEDLLALFKTGTGSVLFCCDFELDEKDKCVVISGLTPWFNVEKTHEKILDKCPYISNVVDHSADNEIRIRLEFKRNVNIHDMRDKLTEIESLLTQSMNFKFNVVTREPQVIVDERSGKKLAELDSEFVSYTFPEFFTEWAKWRVDLEIKVLQRRKELLLAQIAYKKLLILAISKLDIIFQVLKSKVENIDEVLAKKLQVSLDDAKTILNLPLRRLSKMSGETILKEIKGLEINVREVREHLKTPNLVVSKNLQTIANSC